MNPRQTTQSSTRPDGSASGAIRVPSTRWHPKPSLLSRLGHPTNLAFADMTDPPRTTQPVRKQTTLACTQSIFTRLAPKPREEISVRVTLQDEHQVLKIIDKDKHITQSFIVPKRARETSQHTTVINFRLHSSKQSYVPKLSSMIPNQHATNLAQQPQLAKAFFELNYIQNPNTYQRTRAMRTRHDGYIDLNKVTPLQTHLERLATQLESAIHKLFTLDPAVRKFFLKPKDPTASKLRRVTDCALEIPCFGPEKNKALLETLNGINHILGLFTANGVTFEHFYADVHKLPNMQNSPLKTLIEKQFGPGTTVETYLNILSNMSRQGQMLNNAHRTKPAQQQIDEWIFLLSQQTQRYTHEHPRVAKPLTSITDLLKSSGANHTSLQRQYIGELVSHATIVAVEFGDFVTKNTNATLINHIEKRVFACLSALATAAENIFTPHAEDLSNPTIRDEEAYNLYRVYHILLEEMTNQLHRISDRAPNKPLIAPSKQQKQDNYAAIALQLAEQYKDVSGEHPKVSTSTTENIAAQAEGIITLRNWLGEESKRYEEQEHRLSGQLNARSFYRETLTRKCFSAWRNQIPSRVT